MSCDFYTVCFQNPFIRLKLTQLNSLRLQRVFIKTFFNMPTKTEIRIESKNYDGYFEYESTFLRSRCIMPESQFSSHHLSH
jgi:hypothetical protein